MDLGWRNDGHLPWRLATLDMAGMVALGKLQGYQRAAAALPRKSAERDVLRKKIRDTERTRLQLREARHILAPSKHGGPHSHVRMYDAEQMVVQSEAHELFVAQLDGGRS